MKTWHIVYAGVFALAAAAAHAQPAGEGAPATTDAVFATAKLAGTFQSYDARNRVMRISDTEYAVSPTLASRQSNRLRDLRFGKQVVFSVSDFDPQGRGVIVEIDSQ